MNTGIKQTPSTTFEVVQNIISQATFSDPQEVTWDTELSEYSLEVFPKIIKALNEHFTESDTGVVLTLSARQVLGSCETVGELVTEIEDQIEY